MVFYRAAGTPPASHSWTGSPACHVAPSSPFSCSPSSRCCRSRAPPTPRRASCRLSRETAPRPPAPDWYDDHSVGGDNHLSWSPAGRRHLHERCGSGVEREPHDIEWQSTVTVGGPGGLEVCGYPSGTVGWMRAYQAAPGAMAGGSCPASRAGGRPVRLVPLRVRPPRRAAQPLAPHGPRALRARAADRRRPDGVGQPLGDLPEPPRTRTLNCERTAARPAWTSASGADEKITSVGDVDAQTIPLTSPTDAPPRRCPNGAVPDRHHGEPVRHPQGGRRRQRQRALRDGEPHDPARPDAGGLSASRRSP